MGASSSIADCQVQNPEEKSLAQLCAERKRDSKRQRRENPKDSNIHRQKPSEIRLETLQTMNKHSALHLDEIPASRSGSTRVRFADSATEYVLLPSIQRPKSADSATKITGRTSDCHPHEVRKSGKLDCALLPRIERQQSEPVRPRSNADTFRVGHLVFAS